MASSFGDSLGSSWGDAWGTIASSSSGGPGKGRRESSTEAIQEDHDIMDIAAIILLSGILED